MALSATCPPRVLDDLVKTLRLKPIVDGTRTFHSFHLSSFIFHLFIIVLLQMRPRAKAWYTSRRRCTARTFATRSCPTIQTMVRYILEHHAGETGIVYCLSQKVCVFSPLSSGNMTEAGLGRRKRSERAPQRERGRHQDGGVPRRYRRPRQGGLAHAVEEGNHYQERLCT
jgi:hypothetical protein